MHYLIHRSASGLLLCGVLAAAAYLIATTGGLGRLGIGPLTMAILLGALVGNGLPERFRDRLRPGVGLAQTRLLRLGVMLYGFNLSFQQIAEVGPQAILMDLAMVSSTLLLGWLVGTRWLRLDRETVLLTSAGSAICGAAAVLATEPVLGAPPHKTAAAVGSVVLFGTLAMALFPVLYRLGYWPAAAFGVYVGATVHEVAQVVAIGKTIGGDVANTAVIVKMIRVMMLAPFLVLVAGIFRGQSAGGRGRAALPWFALGFVVVAGFNSLHWLGMGEVEAMRSADTLILAVAMAALGFETTLARMRQAGRGPLVLGAILFVHLVAFGSIALWLLG
ncbi:MAG: YeiH family protein [Zoogloea sp.]|nr:YeiH family protein [Zoogloea sp.]